MIIFYRYIYRDVGFEYVRVQIECKEYVSIKETKCGYWIAPKTTAYLYGNLKNKGKWISKEGKRRFAYPTKKEALVSLRARIRHRIKLLKYQLTISKSAYDIAENMEET